MHHVYIAVIAVIACFAGSIQPDAAADTYTITLDPQARSEPATGRVVLFFITKEGRRWEHADPIEAPFFDAPQPIASIAVENFKPGESVKIDGTTPAFPASLDALHGKVRVQAILDADHTERSHDAGPGNVFSDVMTLELSSEKDETINVTLTHRIEAPTPPTDLPNLKWVRYRSELLSEFYGRDMYHRAGVALPKNYNDPNWPRQQWPAIYVIPGYGGRDDAAEDYMHMLQAPEVEKIAPNAVFIVLDPEAPLGHHGFANSANNGPRATALVKEFIPYLESQFRLVPQPEARLVTGHSSGGWSSLWLQLNYPNVFGGCWASAPDPITLSAFQMSDLHNGSNVFVDEQGSETPSYRRIIDSTLEPVPVMTVRQEVAMEQAIDPAGRSGQQWAAWNAMYSPRDAETMLPVPMFDPQSGQVNRRVLRHWLNYEIGHQAMGRWESWGPTILNKVRLAVGDHDCYYLNRAVEQFKQIVEARKGENSSDSAGYILIVPGANHGTLISKIFMRWNEEMRQHLQQHGLQDPDAPGASKSP